MEFETPYDKHTKSFRMRLSYQYMCEQGIIQEKYGRIDFWPSQK